MKQKGNFIMDELMKKRQFGTLLAQGKGVNSMMDISYKRKLSNNNSILWVKDTSDINSSWKIYSKPKK